MNPSIFRPVVALIIVLGLTGLVACGGGETPAGSSADGYPSQIIKASGPQGSGWYPISVLFSDIWMDELDGVTVTVTEGAGLANLRSVNEGVDADIGITFANDFMDAVNGRGSFEQPLGNILAMADLYPSHFYIAVLESSDIYSIEDLLGKHLVPGEQGFSGEQVTRIVLDLYGITYEDIEKAGGKISYGGYNDAVQQMRDGIVDAVSLIGAPAVPALTELDVTTPVRLIPIDPGKLDELINSGRGYIRATVPANTYKNLTEDFVTVGLSSLIFARVDLNEDFVYDATKAIWDNLERIRQEQPARGGAMDVKTALQSVPAELFHPGSLRYYREAGVID